MLVSIRASTGNAYLSAAGILSRARTHARPHWLYETSPKVSRWAPLLRSTYPDGEPRAPTVLASDKARRKGANTPLKNDIRRRTSRDLDPAQSFAVSQSINERVRRAGPRPGRHASARRNRAPHSMSVSAPCRPCLSVELSTWRLAFWGGAAALLALSIRHSQSIVLSRVLHSFKGCHGRRNGFELPLSLCHQSRLNKSVGGWTRRIAMR